MSTVICKLNATEWAAAAAIGRKREELRVADLGKQREWKVKKNDRTVNNEHGAIAEYALAKHYGKTILQDWCETKAFVLKPWLVTADLGKNIQVRSTTYQGDAGRLILKHKDPSDAVYVLGQIDDSALTIHYIGWAFGWQVKHGDHWTTKLYEPAFRYENHLLSSMDTIPPEAIWL